MGNNGRTGDAASGLTPPTPPRERMSSRARGLLAKPLDRLIVAERESRDGRLLRYLEGWAVINQSNRIFGYDGWGAELVGDVGFRPLRLVDPDTETPLALGMYSAVVRVTVRGCPPRSDAGCGFVAADTPDLEVVGVRVFAEEARHRASGSSATRGACRGR